MARIRTLKPDFFTSEDIVALSPLARLLYQATWCEADREGRFVWRPKTLKLRYLPGDDCDIEALADEIVRRSLVVRYVVNGQSYAVIPSFTRHQVINNREAASVIPPPPEPDASLTCPAHDDDACSTRDDVAGTPLVGRERKGRSVHASRVADAPPVVGNASDRPTKAGTRLPSEWTLPDSWKEEAKKKKPTWTEDHIQHVATQFKDYWLAASGANARKVDWLACWRLWVSREKDAIVTAQAPSPQSEIFKGAL